MVALEDDRLFGAPRGNEADIVIKVWELIEESPTMILTRGIQYQLTTTIHLRRK